MNTLFVADNGISNQIKTMSFCFLQTGSNGIRNRSPLHFLFLFHFTAAGYFRDAQRILFVIANDIADDAIRPRRGTGDLTGWDDR